MALLVGVYRHGNAEHVRRLLEPALEHRWRTAWWALDETHEELRDVTVGQGPGAKLPLVNETLRRVGTTASWTVVSDDDLRFRRGDVVEFVDRCVRAQLDLAQPARVRGTHEGHAITAQRRRSRARTTTLIESGPLFAVGPRCRDRILPFPEERGMGWGIEIDWHDLLGEGCRLGIVDAALIEHLGVREYDDTEMRRRLLEELKERGQPNWGEMRRTLQIWRPWQRKPPWHTA
jgi:hypothetical protein